jgi:hypothetical protein
VLNEELIKVVTTLPYMMMDIAIALVVGTVLAVVLVVNFVNSQGK